MKHIAIALILLGFSGSIYGDELRVRGGVFAGTHDPDLEKKFRNDTVYGAFLGGAVGFDTPWQNKSAGGMAFGIQYKAGSWIFESDSHFVKSDPDYNSLSGITGNVSGTQISVSQFSNTKVTDLVRLAESLRAGYTLTRAAPGHEISILGGLRYILISANYDVISAGSVSAGTASSPLFGKSLEGTSSGRGLGPEFGAEYAYNFDFGGRLYFRGLLYSASGRWQYRRITITALSTSASGLWREEDGRYHIAGRSAMFGYSHPVTDRVRLYAAFLTEKSETRDLQVKLFRLAAPVQSSDFSNFALDTALTRPGSHSTDALSGFTFGVEAQIL